MRKQGMADRQPQRRSGAVSSAAARVVSPCLLRYFRYYSCAIALLPKHRDGRHRQSSRRRGGDVRFRTDVLATARAAHAAIPDVPPKGCDIIRKAATGRLCVLEVNPGGNTWHFSSRFLADRRATNGVAFESQRLHQFDAFRTAARVLVERVRLEAE